MGALVGLWITLLTFPGVIVHEFAHKLACDRARVPVLDVCYFRIGNPAGYVLHAQPKRYRQSFAISVAPFFVNTVLAFAFLLGYAWLDATTAGIWSSSTETQASSILLLWLGISVGIHAFPSTGDANTLWSRSRAEWRTTPTVLLGVPIVVLIYVANLLSRLYLDVFYAICLWLGALAAAGVLIG